MGSLPKSLIISISGVRGIAERDLNPETIQLLIRSYISIIDKGKFIIAGDSRTHTPRIKKQVAETLVGLGCKVLDAGLQPTPTLSFSISALKARGGIVITASHNPEKYNGLKFFDHTGHYLNQNQINQLVKNCLKEQGNSFSKKSGAYQKVSGIEKFHIKKLLKLAAIKKIKKRNLKVLVDCANGAGCFFIKKLLQRLGCKYKLVNDNPSKPFPHPPEPNPKNLESLNKIILSSNFDIGFATDPDCDRLVILTPRRGVVSEEYTLALSLKRIIPLRPAGKIVINYDTSLLNEYLVKNTDFKIVRTSVGENNVYEKIKKTKAVFGGEGHGGVMDPEINSTRDGFTAMVHILSLLAETDQTIDEIIDNLPRFHLLKDKIPLRRLSLKKIYREIKRTFPKQKQSLEDGIRISWGNKWLLFRPSGTEPIARITAEAPVLKEARELIHQIKKIAKDG